MEGNCVSGSPPASVDICCANELNPSGSDASTLTAEICEDILHHSPGDSTMWTDEKHSSYLEQLEVSFVKQLHQSISLLAQCSNHNEGDKGIPQVHPVDTCDVSEQLAAPVHGCREKINCNRGDPLSHVSVDSLVHIKRPRLYHSKHIGTKCPNASAHTPDTSSQQISASNQYCDSHDLVKEGTGQNFADNDNETNSITKSRVKRLKTVLPE